MHFKMKYKLNKSNQAKWHFKKKNNKTDGICTRFHYRWGRTQQSTCAYASRASDRSDVITPFKRASNDQTLFYTQYFCWNHFALAPKAPLEYSRAALTHANRDKISISAPVITHNIRYIPCRRVINWSLKE